MAITTTQPQQPHTHTHLITFTYSCVFRTPTQRASLPGAFEDGSEDQGGRSQLGRGAEAAESHLRRLAAADRKLGNHPAGEGIPGDFGS